MHLNGTILLVEDDTVDALTVKRALRQINGASTLIHVSNGEEALACLRDPQQPHPCIILLDINMPRMNGIEFLRTAKQDPELKKIPVVMLTTSNNDRDILQTFHWYAAGYMLKSVDYDQFVETMRVIDAYWKLSRLPARTEC